MMMMMTMMMTMMMMMTSPSFPGTHTGGIWMGGSDMLLEGEWIWANYGEVIDFRDWGPGEPNSLDGTEECLDMYQVHDFHWNDNSCEIKQNFMCEERCVIIYRNMLYMWLRVSVCMASIE
jgi:hypothetical protein